MMSLAGIAFMFAMLASCSGQSNGTGGIDRPNPKLKTLTLSIGNVKVQAEIAATEIERNRGLMFRKTLTAGNGMLFVFDYDQKVSFWMKNTSLPLSIAYIASDGTITQILDLAPHSEEPRPSERSIRYALEVPQGWFSQTGVKVGDVLSIPPLK
jgi:uncharacterized membrane protein (UPF0127 family)